MASKAAQLDRRFTKSSRNQQDVYSAMNIKPQQSAPLNEHQQSQIENVTQHILTNTSKLALQNFIKVKKCQSKLVIPKALIQNKLLASTNSNLLSTASSIQQKSIIQKIHIKKDKKPAEDKNQQSQQIEVNEEIESPIFYCEKKTNKENDLPARESILDTKNKLENYLNDTDSYAINQNNSNNKITQLAYNVQNQKNQSVNYSRQVSTTKRPPKPPQIITQIESKRHTIGGELLQPDYCESPLLKPMKSNTRIKQTILLDNFKMSPNQGNIQQQQLQQYQQTSQYIEKEKHNQKSFKILTGLTSKSKNLQKVPFEQSVYQTSYINEFSNQGNKRFI
ncbi:UNKNOWN [Stylonychia lemnae]|uniref:Uncharacterized protein n=1 Tax=Stylonychia lemnae TaxID=5949 RepID=A0A078B1Q5_STYLE|nr:UNKNOWN [Stylonychia lemnae]|eukprot:CDW88236.1 UNKNOWN [Stylonychia lemnae]